MIALKSGASYVKLIKSYFRDDRGSSALEYALIASCVSAGAFGSIDFATNLASAPLSKAQTSITIEVDENDSVMLTDEDIIELSIKALGLDASD